MTPTPTSPDRLRHGHLTTYVKHKCRCEACKTASREYARTLARRRAYGRMPARTTVGPARNHTLDLMDYGMSLEGIAEAAGTTYARIHYIVYGDGNGTPARTIRADIAQKVLQVRPDPALAYRADATGVIRRIRALVAIGYPVKQQTRLLGKGHNQLQAIMRRGTCNRDIRREITDLYDRLSMTPNHPTDLVQAREARKARERAIARGWAPPLAWDDDTIDDPTARPYGVPRTPRRTAA